MWNLIHISQWTDEWNMTPTHIEYILDYAHDVFNEIPKKDFRLWKDDNGYTHLLINKDQKEIEDLSDEDLRSKISYMDGFVWGISYASLSKPKTNSESQNKCECKGTE